MAKPRQIKKLRELGYRVEESHPGGEDFPPIYHVEGFGLATYAREDDVTAWRSFTTTHDERVAEAIAREAAPE
jgi:hypothetical protein